MKESKKVLMTLIIGVMLVATFYMITAAISRYTGFFVREESSYNDFDLCLQEQTIKVYLNTNNLAQSLKELVLFDLMHNFEIKNCVQDNTECMQRGINKFPTWIVNDRKINRDLAIDELKEYSGCKPRV
ncbi:hypothetical protein GOV14_01465 [Candidatus Pacearchaeota archaeon]|nr:hypothetical protein [Candidatus Pacearchaeota archaeon]